MVDQIYVLGLSLNYVSWCDETLSDFCYGETLVFCKKKINLFENISLIKMYYIQHSFEAFGAVLLVPKLSVSQQSHRFMQSSNEAF